jgi:hypothetical protein
VTQLHLDNGQLGKVMPQYFIKAGYLGHPGNAESIELKDDHAAWEEATVACAEILKDMDGQLMKSGEWRMEVFDAFRKPLYTLRLIPEAHK